MGYSINTNQHTPFASIENEKLIVEICDSLSIGAAIENMILTATGYGLGTLWIANTCFAYNELMDFIGTDLSLIHISQRGRTRSRGRRGLIWCRRIRQFIRVSSRRL